MTRRLMVVLAGCAILAVLALVARPVSAQAPAPVPAKMHWWKNARFGMFIHWDPSSVAGAEISWSRNPNPGGPNPSGIPAAVYDKLYTKFDPVKFNPAQVVGLAKQAGMKYIVFTTKHHGGFCMFDSAYTSYKVTSPLCPYHKDIVGQLSSAAHKAGIHWGIYYSQVDLHQPDYGVNQPAYDLYLRRQIDELLTHYGKVDVVWFDGLGHDASFWDANSLFADIHRLDPTAIINDRCGLPGDFYTPEQRIGAYDDQRPWETCMTISTGWSYHPNDTYKSAKECIQDIARCVGGDGNMLLDIGPRPDGTIDPGDVAALQGIGAWMKVNGAAVYGTRGGPYKPSFDYVSTRNSRTVFIHVLGWDGNSIDLPALPLKVESACVLGHGKVRFRQTASSLTITVPPAEQSGSDTVVALKVAGGPLTLSPIAPVNMHFKNAAASNIYHGMSDYSPDKAFDGEPDTRWATDDSVRQCWISADLAQPTVIHGVEIVEAYPGRVAKFEFQYKRPGETDWTTLVTGTTLGPHFTASFPSVMAASVRLNILAANHPPTITEIRVNH